MYKYEVELLKANVLTLNKLLFTEETLRHLKKQIQSKNIPFFYDNEKQENIGKIFNSRIKNNSLYIDVLTNKKLDKNYITLNSCLDDIVLARKENYTEVLDLKIKSFSLVDVPLYAELTNYRLINKNALEVE